MLCCIVLYCIPLYCIVLYCIVGITNVIKRNAEHMLNIPLNRIFVLPPFSTSPTGGKYNVIIAHQVLHNDDKLIYLAITDNTNTII